MAKPYDPKKSCWYPVKEGGFDEGVIQSAEGDKVMYLFGHTLERERDQNMVFNLLRYHHRDK